MTERVPMGNIYLNWTEITLVSYSAGSMMPLKQQPQ
jgi:hypothetical protein